MIVRKKQKNFTISPAILHFIYSPDLNGEVKFCACVGSPERSLTQTEKNKQVKSVVGWIYFVVANIIRRS
ncbi:hypothetical protein WN51_07272 [Melipona quadrifasciata]|uniref:Uncharacterized protein n=1 Tax=Melipona quadrifasciata TaxID=166423 RepID=A0A0M8ZSS2_9HYME|nr:hypothetical protein WN51_07272 [Melipona quadrifasciata]